VLAVFAITLSTFVIVVGVLLWVKTPHYLMQKVDVIQLLEKVLVGQASENEWAIFLSSSFRHAPELETVRDACINIDETEYLGYTRDGFLFSERGLLHIKQLLDQLR